MKTLVCFCEDIELREIEAALDAGHLDLESLKRATGFGTGICQGKSCIASTAQCLAKRLAAGGLPTRALLPFTARTPLHPTSLRLLASEIISLSERPRANSEEPE